MDGFFLHLIKGLAGLYEEDLSFYAVAGKLGSGLMAFGFQA